MVRLIWGVISSCALLNLFGFCLDLFYAQRHYGHRMTYFRYEIHSLDYFPYWIMATLLLILFNGVAIVKHSRIRAAVYRFPGGGGGVDAPLPILQLVGFNMVFHFVLITMFVFVRYHGW